MSLKLVFGVRFGTNIWNELADALLGTDELILEMLLSKKLLVASESSEFADNSESGTVADTDTLATKYKLLLL